MSQEDQQRVDFGYSDKLAILSDVLEMVEAKKNLCMQKRWKYKKSNGEDVIPSGCQCDPYVRMPIRVMD